MLADEHRLVIHGDGDPQISFIPPVRLSSNLFVSLTFSFPARPNKRFFNMSPICIAVLIWQSCGAFISRMLYMFLSRRTIPYTCAYIMVHHDTVDLQYRREACLFRREVPSLVACLEILQVVVFLEGFRTSLGEKEAVAPT